MSVYPDGRPLQFVSEKIAPALKTPTLQRHGFVWVSFPRAATCHTPLLEEWYLDISQRSTLRRRRFIQSFQMFRRRQWIPDDAGITGRHKGDS